VLILSNRRSIIRIEESHMNLIVKYKLTRETGPQVCAAVRMKLDGRGNLTLFDATAPTRSESIAMENVEWIEIHHLPTCRKAA
jgi:hypothetical protein